MTGNRLCYHHIILKIIKHTAIRKALKYIGFE